MRSIPTIFCYDKVTHQVTSRPLQMAKWVLEGKGIATKKYDGVAIKVEHGKVFRRFEWRPNSSLPIGFQKLQDFDPKKPKAPIPGWVPVPTTFLTSPANTDERCLSEAWKSLMSLLFVESSAKLAETVKRYSSWTVIQPIPVYVPDGTYELCGPKIHNNHENLKTHVLIPHGEDVVKKVPRTFEGLKKFLETFDGEGIVWHYQTDSGKLMAKIKRSDFGFTTRITKQDVEMAYGTPSTEVKSEEQKEEQKEVSIA